MVKTSVYAIDNGYYNGFMMFYAMISYGSEKNLDIIYGIWLSIIDDDHG